MEVEGDDKELSPEGDERVMEGESVEEGGEEEEEEEEDEGPPPRPGRRVKFEQRDRLAVEFEERNMCQRSKRGGEIHIHVWCREIHDCVLYGTLT